MADDDKLVVEATPLEVGLADTDPVPVDEPGEKDPPVIVRPPPPAWIKPRPRSADEKDDHARIADAIAKITDCDCPPALPQQFETHWLNGELMGVRVTKP